MKKRICACILIFATLMCTACDKEGQELVVADKTTAVSFSWWGNDARHQYTMDGLDTFMEKNPDIYVNMEYGVWSGFEKRNKMEMKSHTESDVMQINYAWLSEYSEDGLGYYDLNTLSDYIDFSNYEDSDLEYGIKSGKLNAIPIAYNAYAFFYNKSVYDFYGLDIPKNWDDLFDAAEVMRKDGIYPLGTVKKQVLSILIAHYEQIHGQRVFSEDGQLAINEKQMEELFYFYRQMIDAKVLCPIGDFDRSAFTDGRVAGTICWISDSSNYADPLVERGFEVSLGESLTTDNAKSSGWYMKPATMYAISAHTEQPEEAARLLNYLVNDKDMALLQKNEKGVPVSASARAALKEAGEVGGYEYIATNYLAENKESYGKMLPIMENADIIDAFKNNGDDYLYDKISLEECAKVTVETINQQINGK